MTIAKFRREILSWYLSNKRDLPWRHTHNPYKILISEIMLQQTQIARVIPKYKQFLAAFPTLSSLAKARPATLLKVWQGLGYWKRALHLRETARKILRGHGGKFPKYPKELQKFPGIGHYTARAIACFAFRNPEAFLDTNIRRVYLHFFFKKRREVPDEEILRIAQKAVWQKNPREWHYALMDYGNLVLGKKKSINRKSRKYRKQTKFKGSFRFFRAKALSFILAQPRQRISHKKLVSFLKNVLKESGAKWKAKQIIASLQKDNLICKNRIHFFIK